MLQPLDAWVKRLKKTSPVDTPFLGAKNLADFYGDMADQVQGGPTGAPGIFTFNRPLFAATLAPTLLPDPLAPSWAVKIATAWQVACLASVVTPGTVQNPTWFGSGGIDALTIPIGAASIPTIPLGKVILLAGLIASAAQFQDNPEKSQELFAKAFRDATKAFIFISVGLTLAPTPIPSPAL